MKADVTAGARSSAGNEQRARGTFDEIARRAATAAEVEERFRTPWFQEFATAFLGDGALARIGGRRVLDVGCGVGTYLRALVDRGAEPVGIDLSQETLMLARAALGPGVPLAQGSACSLPCRSGTFDAVICMGVMCYVPPEDCPSAILELARVTAPNGEVLLHVKNLWSLTGLGVVVKTLYRTLRGRQTMVIYYRTVAWYRKRLPRGVRVLGTIGWGVVPARSPFWRRVDRWILSHAPMLHVCSSELYLRLRVDGV